MFGHEKFGAYRYAIEFVTLVAQIIERLPEGQAKFIDQFRRAAVLVVLNIAEGSGKTTRAQRNHCYAVARGEAMECAAIIDILECMHMLDSTTYLEPRNSLKISWGFLALFRRKRDEMTTTERPTIDCGL